MKNVCDESNSEAINIGDAVTDNATVFAMRVFAAGWISAVIKHGTELDEDGYWVGWDDNFDLHFFADDQFLYCIRYEVRNGQTQMSSALMLFSSSVSVSA